jgi:hypothetical protein
MVMLDLNLCVLGPAGTRVMLNDSAQMDDFDH